MRTPQLIHFFASRRYSATQGMNWLQERGWISDECVTVDDVAWADALRIFREAKAFWCIPPCQQTKQTK